jgi:hygromycin-B 7''-O-kinase
MRERIYETSKRLGPIGHDQLSRTLARFDLGDLLKVEPVPFGLFGQNLFITSSVGEFVFRGAPLGPPQFPTERFFTRLLHERTSVPVPWPYQIDDSCDFFPWSYADCGLAGIRWLSGRGRFCLESGPFAGLFLFAKLDAADLSADCLG